MHPMQAIKQVCDDPEPVEHSYMDLAPEGRQIVRHHRGRAPDERDKAEKAEDQGCAWDGCHGFAVRVAMGWHPVNGDAAKMQLALLCPFKRKATRKGCKDRGKAAR